MSIPEPLKQSNICPLESPFAWRVEQFCTPIRASIFSSLSDVTISFTSKRISKVYGYLPLIGTIVGVYRIFKGYIEFQFFKNGDLHYLSERGIKWITRGTIELFPVIGGIICIFTDIIATCFFQYPNNKPRKIG